jgi:hypothetical protein
MYDDIAADHRQTLVRAVEPDVAAAVAVDHDVTALEFSAVTTAIDAGLVRRGRACPG